MDVPRETVENAARRGGLEEAHWRAEDGKRHPLMQLTTGLCVTLVVGVAVLGLVLGIPR